jgi:hypothetical protein
MVGKRYQPEPTTYTKIITDRDPVLPPESDESTGTDGDAVAADSSAVQLSLFSTDRRPLLTKPIRYDREWIDKTNYNEYLKTDRASVFAKLVRQAICPVLRFWDPLIRWIPTVGDKIDCCETCVSGGGSGSEEEETTTATNVLVGFVFSVGIVAMYILMCIFFRQVIDIRILVPLIALVVGMQFIFATAGLFEGFGIFLALATLLIVFFVIKVIPSEHNIIPLLLLILYVIVRYTVYPILFIVV